MRNEVQTQIAKLLSKENISVIHGEYRTAFFDVENRVLGLPEWKDKGKAVYDLLVGHEVGHALYTPVDGWHESDKEIPGVPRSFLNVIEDIRIERKIQQTYPGIVASFLRGYTQLADDNFFGVEDHDIPSLALIDRINLLAKVGKHYDVKFSDIEQPLVDEAMSVETWDDVMAVAKKIADFMKEQQEEEAQQKVEAEIINDEEDNNDSNESESTNDSMDFGSGGEGSGQDGNQSEATQQVEVPGSESSDENGSETDTPESSTESDTRSGSAGTQDSELLESVTDNAFRQAEKSMVIERTGYDAGLVQAPSREAMFDSIVSYEEIAQHRIDRDTRDSEYYCPDMMQDYVDRRNRETDELMGKFYSDNKKILAHMVKEFEARKAAYQYSRGRSAKSGTINMNKLHEYKYNDDIFLRVTQLADAKNHGVVMFIDKSGSMSSIMNDVFKQTVLIIEFCRRVGIPFEVYGFTRSGIYGRESNAKAMHGQMTMRDVGITELVNSKMRKAKMKEAIRGIFHSMTQRYSSRYDEFGATPLIETIMAAHHIVGDFIKKHHVSKPVALFITDGEPTQVNFGYGGAARDHAVERWAREWEVPFAGKMHTGNYVDKMGSLLETLGKSTGAKTVAVHIADSNREARRWIWAREDYTSTDSHYKKWLKNGKEIHIESIGGFDHAFIISNKNHLKGKDDKFVVDDNLSDRRLKTAFKQFNQSKKSNRAIMSAFAGAIAA